MGHAKRVFVLSGVYLFACVVGAVSAQSVEVVEPAAYHSPYDVAFSPDGELLAVSDRTAASAWLIDVAAASVVRRVALRGEPTGVAWAADGARVYVSEYGASTVAEIDASSGDVLRRLPVGRYPKGLAVAAKRGLLLVADSVTHGVSVVELRTGRERGRVRVPREPHYIAVTPDEQLAVVGNLLPAGAANAPGHAAVVSLIDPERAAHVADVRLPAGSTGVRQVAVSRDGRWVYAVHSLGRTSVPATQLERGWVNTSALSVIDLPARAHYATVLLDHPMEGAADPWGLVVSNDGGTLWVSLSGVHQLARIDLDELHSLMAGGLPDDHPLARAGHYGPGTESIWVQIGRDAKYREELVNDLAALYGADLIERNAIPGQGPRGLSLSPDGSRLAAAVYFAGQVALIDAASGEVDATVRLGVAREPDRARLGQMIFHDATRCFQHWMSCATCHPNDGRVDGLNWDLPNDGIGNPKNNKSLLLAGQTPPMTWRGARADMDTSVERGFLFLMRQPEPGEVEAVRAYLRSLKPQPSPYLEPDGGLSPPAERGRAIFERPAARCARCHSGPLLTDLQAHDVGTRGEFDHASRFDTPSLIEVDRTAPYLHDGSAATLLDVFLAHNERDRHGVTSHLSERELADLIAYLRSL